MAGVRCRMGVLYFIIDPLRIPSLVMYSSWGESSLLELLYPLLHLFSHRLVRAHECLLVDDDFGGIGFRTTDSGCDRRGIGLDDDAVVDGLVKAQEHQVEVLQHGTLLDLIAQQERHGVEQRSENGIEHDLVFGRTADDIEDEVERVAKDGEMAVKEDYVAAWFFLFYAIDPFRTCAGPLELGVRAGVLLDGNTWRVRGDPRCRG